MITLLFTNIGKCETVALSNDPNFIKASILVTSPGKLPYQIVGHAAIRMECPQYGFDRVFSFGNNGGNNLYKIFIEGVLGNVNELEYKDYVREFKNEGRQVKAYPLNLELNEKARLWEVLDSLKMTPNRPFDITDSHCFSVISEAIEIAVLPEKILWDEPASQSKSYSENTFRSGGENYPWNYMLIMATFGNRAEKSGIGKTFVYPTTFEFAYDKFRIADDNSMGRPLITGQPIVLEKEEGNHTANRPTPTETALILLILVSAVTLFQYSGKLVITGKILDYVLWITVTAGGVFIMFITYAPINYTDGWNWPLIVMNPIAWIPIVLINKTKNKHENLKKMWMLYAAVLILFAAFIKGIAPSVEPGWRLFAIALSIRCVWQMQHQQALLSRMNHKISKRKNKKQI